MSAARGLLGFCIENPDEADAVLGRLSASRRDRLVRLTAKAAAGRRWTVVMPDASSASRAVDAVIVSFVGHLIRPIPGIEIGAGNPAEAVRLAYAKLGVACLGLLEGNFCVAIFDPRLPGFILARDAAGTKPLFHSHASGFLFGSSAIEILRASGMRTVANPRALYRYLADGAVAGETETLFEGVSALPGAHYLEAVLGEAPRVCPVPLAADAGRADGPRSFEALSEELRHLLQESVKAQSYRDRSGVALSGGIDSSGVMASLRATAVPHQPLHAFCFVHGHRALPQDWVELPWAQLMAKAAGATLHPVTLESSAIPRAMSVIFEWQEFPFGSPVILAQAEVFRAAAEHGMEVMLSGHGPDYLLGGGNSHIIVRAASLLRRARFSSAWRFLSGASSYAASRPARLFIQSLREAVPLPRRADGLRPAPPWMRKSWFLEREALRRAEPVSASTDPLQRLILEQLHRSRLPSSLLWEECNALASGVDNRQPYLVAPMLRFAARLPAEHLVSDAGQTRPLLRHALRGLVPDAILDRPHPVGFAVPALPWLHEQRPWVEDCIRELKSLPFYRGSSTAVLWDRLHAGESRSWIAAFGTWRWLSLLAWARAYGVHFD